MSPGRWMRANLATQGYRLADEDARRLAGLLFAGATTAGLVLGGALVAACSVVTTSNFCLPSEALAWWERRTTRKEVIAT